MIKTLFYFFPAIFLLIPQRQGIAGNVLFHDNFESGILHHWRIENGQWSIREGRCIAEGPFSMLVYSRERYCDFEVTAEVSYSHDESHAAAGIVFRYNEDSTGYAVCLREIEKGKHPRFGPWERPVLQLFRMDREGWKFLQESKVMDCWSDILRQLKVLCRGPNIWIFYQDMSNPILTEYDPKYNRAGKFGLWKDHLGTGMFDDVMLSKVDSVPTPPLCTDWSWVRGAVYIRSNAVNSVQMWHDYWDHTEILDRELFYASYYGFNMVQVYLHWIVWNRHKEEYLNRIDDFLTRASKYGLKTNLILWDDCGHVEPSLIFSDPIPGRHNSQMMPNPSHRIRDSVSEMTAHKEQFKDYVESVAKRFKNDKRISFWQLYNEGMGAREKYRISQIDANLNHLLGWTREWVKGTGTLIPVTATGGGFYGPQYSDFYTYHSYSNGKDPLPNTDGGPEHLCTETLNRPDADLIDCLREFEGKQNGFIVWELMIGNDNCRYPWGHPDGFDEPAEPFHGVVYPDGHPWSTEEIKSLLGEAAFSDLQKKVFQVEYFEGQFKTRKKVSITPRIDFDLGDEYGYGSPDALAGIGKDNFSIRWTCTLTAPATGFYTFYADCDGELELCVNQTQVIKKNTHLCEEKQGSIRLIQSQSYPIRIEYYHSKGQASNHIFWSGPGISKQILHLD